MGKMYGGGGYVWISYYLCAVEMLSLYMLCLVMDGAYRFFVPQHNGSFDNNHYFCLYNPICFYKGMDSHIVSP